MSKVLITGGAGYIGLNVALCFLESGDKVVIVDDLKNSYKKNVNNLLKRFNNLSFYKANVCSESFMDGIFKANHFDIVIHLSAKKYVNESMVHPKAYMHNNIHSLKVVLALCKKYGVKKVAFASSITVYGNSQSINISEDEPLNPISPYALSKKIGEELIAKWQKENDGFAIIFRFTNPIGANTKFMLGDNSKLKKLSLPAYIVSNVLCNLPLKFNGNTFNTVDGTPVRDYIHVCDLARIVFEMCKKYNKKQLEIINVGCGKNGYSVLQILGEIENYFGKINYSFGERKQGDVARLVCNNSKLKSYGLMPKLGLFDMLQSEIAFRQYITKIN